MPAQTPQRCPPEDARPSPTGPGTPRAVAFLQRCPEPSALLGAQKLELPFPAGSGCPRPAQHLPLRPSASFHSGGSEAAPLLLFHPPIFVCNILKVGKSTVSGGDQGCSAAVCVPVRRCCLAAQLRPPLGPARGTGTSQRRAAPMPPGSGTRLWSCRVVFGLPKRPWAAEMLKYLGFCKISLSLRGALEPS